MPPPPRPDWYRHKIGNEQLDMVWTHARLGMVVATAFAVVLAVGLRGDAAPSKLVDAWLALKLAVSGFRFIQGWLYARRATHPPAWATATLMALVADGATWGVAGFYVIYTAPWPTASFFAAVLACISCVATFGLQVSARFTMGYAVPILAPTAMGLFMRGELYGELGGIGLLMLLGLQMATAARTEKRIQEGIQLRLQAEVLAQDKAEALKAAMRQSAVRTQFLANISHELRTPLHGILGVARLLRDALPEPALRRRVGLIETSGAHLLNLINDLLDISRIESGQFLIRSEPSDLAAIIEQMAGVYAVRCEEKGLGFQLQENLPKPCWVMVDPGRFRQVLHNLLGNAVKFTVQGGVTLCISRDDSTGTVRAEVRDTGPGIPTADLGRIFEAFQQSAASGGTAEGAGLGLTIARDIARAMGGDVVAQSMSGEGSTLTFTARLPTATVSGGFAATSAAAQPSRPAPCKALLAEDNDVNALVAMNFLEILGMQAVRVKDGAEALHEALSGSPRPDVILMDCQMPVMSGYQASRMIREQERALGLPRVPILALTATASDSERQDCLDAGMDDFVSKPCTLEELAEAIARWSGPAVTPPKPANGTPQQAGA
ncbi:MAG: response regulator [Aquabacterium sp.]|nr:response regulator [Aquabacterium sp.]